MAEGYLRHLAEKAGVPLEVASAGTASFDGALPSPQAVEVARRFGADISSHRSSPLTVEELERSDLVVPMTSSHEMAILTMSPDAKSKTKRLGEFGEGGDVSDPFGGSVEIYQACFEGMREALDRLFESLAADARRGEDAKEK